MKQKTINVYDTLWSKEFKERQKILKGENKDKIESFVKAGLKNGWLSRKFDIEDGDFVCEDFLTRDSFVIIETREFLKEFLNQGNWAINQGIIFGDFALINQINGGDEWAMFKYNPEKKTAFQFESWSYIPMIRDGEFEDNLDKIGKATDEQLNKLEY